MTKIIISLEKKEHFRIAREIQDYVDGWKINHIGWEIISQSRFDEFAPLNRYRLSNDKEVFVDFKLWDTPNTVKTVVESIIKKGGTMTTISTFNNESVFDELEQYKNDIKLLAVTYLTSWNGDEQYQICREMSDFMWRRQLSRVKGFYGVICSAQDIGMLSGADKKLKRVCPGIALPIRRAAPSGQVRITTPKNAKELGADYLVIGRAVTESKDPVKIIKDIREQLAP